MFLTSGGGHPADIIAVAICNILAFSVGAVVKLAAGKVEALLADAMVVLAAEMVEVPLAGVGACLSGRFLLCGMLRIDHRKNSWLEESGMIV